MEETRNEALELVAVTFDPPAIRDRFDELEAYVDRQLEPYQGATIDINSDQAIKDARRAMAALNDLKNPIEAQRKAVKRAYEQPLKEFEARVKAITGKIDAARVGIKDQVDEADRLFKETRRGLLKDQYEGMAGVLAELIPFDSVLDAKWLNRSTALSKAQRELDAATSEAAKGYEALQRQELSHPDECFAQFARTLSVTDALRLDAEIAQREQDERERIEAQRQAIAEIEGVRNQADIAHEATEATQDAATDQCETDMPKLWKWSLTADFTGSEDDARAVAQALKSLGVTGKIRRIQ